MRNVIKYIVVRLRKKENINQKSFWKGKQGGLDYGKTIDYCNRQRVWKWWP